MCRPRHTYLLKPRGAWASAYYSASVYSVLECNLKLTLKDVLPVYVCFDVTITVAFNMLVMCFIRSVYCTLPEGAAWPLATAILL